MPEALPESQRRLFFALWPSENLREQIEGSTRAPARESGGRLIPARNFHVTVLFLGEVAQSHLHAVIEAGAATSSPAFTLMLDRIDAWSRSRVLALTGRQTPPELAALAASLRFSLLSQQIKLKHEVSKQQVFRPHITLARDLPRSRPPQNIAPIEWPVRQFALIDSTVTRGGSEYQVLGHWPLSDSPA